MSVKGYRFVSPGIFLREIDKSVLEPARPERGPIVIGRFPTGTGMKPRVLESKADFLDLYGYPHPGGSSTDGWRGAAHGGPTYGAYAAYAWLQNAASPVTVVRLLGEANNAATTAGAAGWDTKNSAGSSVTHVVDTTTRGSGRATNGGAYGLFISNKPATTSAYHEGTGSLAAVWYLTEGSIQLATEAPFLPAGQGLTETPHSGAAGLFISQTGSGGTTYNPSTFRAIIKDGSGNTVKDAVFDFVEGAHASGVEYIRQAFNTDPAATNGTVNASADRATYWLGETFDQMVDKKVHSTGSAGTAAAAEGGQVGLILGLGNSNAEWQQHREDWANAKTGWFISQDVGNASGYDANAAQKLFRFHALDTGEWAQNNLKISIENIAESESSTYRYGTFDVIIRSLGGKDTGNALESFTGLTLDPDSEKYIAKVIGDKYVQWDYDGNVNREYGSFDNASIYIRVEMNESVKAGATVAKLIPFGVYGPPRFQTFSVVSGSTTFKAAHPDEAITDAFVEGSGSIPDVLMWNASLNAIEIFPGQDTSLGLMKAGSNIVFHQAETHNYTFDFPEVRLVQTGALDGSQHRHMGINWSQGSTVGSDTPNFKLDESIKDAVRRLPSYYAADAKADDPYGNAMEYSWIFTLDDLQLENNAGTTSLPEPKAYYVSGSRKAATSWTAASGAFGGSVHTYGLCDIGYDRFSTTLWGGTDGLDLQEAEPFRNSYLDDASGDRTGNYAYNTIRRAIDMVADPEYVECNSMLMPGITETNLTKRLIDVCEARADALAIIDLPSGFTPYTESSSTEINRRGSVSAVVSSLKSRELDSSYGCAYYPWVQVKDVSSTRRVWLPPSVIGLGVMGYSQAEAAVWFAPAGFTRGGLSNQGSRPGKAGLKVLNLRERLTTSDRDKLYAQNINPIAKFPAEGIVVFGQKTLQMTPSALDRINVRRLLIYVKKEISIIAATTIFQPNVQATWDSFKQSANDLLADVKAQFGLEDYLIKLDETTTTDDLKDRNILYAQIYLKPAKAIEFIAVDFIITKSGASFDD